MHYFLDKQKNLVSIDDSFWPSVLKNEPWIKETDSNGNELGKPLIVIKGTEPLKDKVELQKAPPAGPSPILPKPGVTAPKAAPIPAPKVEDVSPEVIEKITKPVETGKFNELEKLKVEKLENKKKFEKLDKTVKPAVEVKPKPKTNAKSTGTKRKRTAKKA